jgi:hypothetical protein
MLQGVGERKKKNKRLLKKDRNDNVQVAVIKIYVLTIEF